MSILDNLDLFEQHDREMEKALSRLPECCHCDQPIQQEMAVRICGKWYCDACRNIYFREVVEEVFV